jgi:hypothetical protein
MSFADYLSLTGDEEKRLMEEAGQRAGELETDARGKLGAAQAEAANRGVALSQTSSYGDYMKAKAAAMAAWQPVAPSSDPRVAAVQGVVGARMGDSQGAMQGRMDARQAGATDAAAQGQRNKYDANEAWKAWQEAQRTGSNSRLNVAPPRGNTEGWRDVLNRQSATPAADYRAWSDATQSAAQGRGGIGASAYYDQDPRLKKPR